ncbi:hypothetical protein KIN20_028231 [Parelaphostrongylus tenuis]|uniref:Uncharacterized protein n=1 Tax=Parelaphostrongylus tenuis TaxID=148309 RepID=A0AAD5R0I7_PARTN|nr:hypothetical protein KIN20_028231 [Parelaphostrongylus tenuis]
MGEKNYGVHFTTMYAFSRTTTFTLDLLYEFVQRIKELKLQLPIFFKSRARHAQRPPSLTTVTQQRNGWNMCSGPRNYLYNDSQSPPMYQVSAAVRLDKSTASLSHEVREFAELSARSVFTKCALHIFHSSVLLTIVVPSDDATQALQLSEGAPHCTQDPFCDLANGSPSHPSFREGTGKTCLRRFMEGKLRKGEWKAMKNQNDVMVLQFKDERDANNAFKQLTALPNILATDKSELVVMYN